MTFPYHLLVEFWDYRIISEPLLFLGAHCLVRLNSLAIDKYLADAATGASIKIKDVRQVHFHLSLDSQEISSLSFIRLSNVGTGTGNENKGLNDSNFSLNSRFLQLYF